MSISDKVSTELLRTLAGAIFRSRATESLARLGIQIGAWARTAATVDDVRRIRAEVDPVHVAAMHHAITHDALSRSLDAAIEHRPLAILREAHAIGELSEVEFTAYAGCAPETAARLDVAEKIAVVDGMLERGVTMIQLDARVAGVSVPAAFAQSPRLLLRIGRGLTPAIPDLELGLEALSCTLAFAGAPHHCVVPWTALYAAANEGGGGVSWHASAPTDIVAEVTAPPAPAQKQPAAARGKLRLVD